MEPRIQNTDRCCFGLAKPSHCDKPRLRVDLTPAIDVVELPDRRLTFVGLHPLFERRVNPRRTILSTKQRERQSGPSQPHPNDRNVPFLCDRRQQRPCSIQRRSWSRELHRIGLTCGRPFEDGFQIVERPVQLSKTDKPLRLSEPRNLIGDVDFQLNPIGTGDNRLPQHQQPVIFATAPMPSVDFTAAREQNRLLGPFQ